MAGTSSGSRNNIPDYETVDLNTRAFHVGAFGILWKEALSQEDVSLQQAEPADDEAAVMEDFLCTPEIAAELKAVCSIAALKSSDKEDTEVIPEDTNLITLKIRQKALERREETILESHAIGKRPKDPGNMIDEAELVLTLNIFYPVIFQKHKLRKPYQTLLVLGSQKLTELRDCISCVSDLQIGGEFSNNPAQAPANISKDLYKSAFFYFEGVFYNDSRFAECRDLSRLIHRDDCLDRSLYPLLTKKHWLWTKKCFVCKMYTARWVTNEDSLAPQEPSFFCDVCFQTLHYDADGNKLGEFLAYPYVDPGIFN
ncbi:hypothetical protein E2320_017219 [Naja naja]|nr:hypothetical protein E2320_017219 [Naja naja]